MSCWITLEAQPQISYGRYLVPNFASNSVCIKGLDGAICVISPGEPLIESFAEHNPELDKDGGRSLRLVAPNSYHFMGLEAWRARYPNAKVFASGHARSQLARKGVANIELLPERADELVQGAFWALPPGHRGGDCWLVYPVGKKWGWVTCDSFLNYPRLSNQPMARAIQKIMGAAPGLKLSRVIKYFLLTDRSRFRRWALKFIRDYPPTILLPAHGEPMVEPSLSGKLEALIRDRL